MNNQILINMEYLQLTKSILKIFKLLFLKIKM